MNLEVMNETSLSILIGMLVSYGMTPAEANTSATTSGMFSGTMNQRKNSQRIECNCFDCKLTHNVNSNMQKCVYEC